MYKMIKLSIISTLLVLAGMAHAACELYCNPAKSHPCGHACISLFRQCHKPTTTACVGENPNRGSGPVYDNPKHVEPELATKSTAPKAGAQ